MGVVPQERGRGGFSGGSSSTLQVPLHIPRPRRSEQRTGPREHGDACARPHPWFQSFESPAYETVSPLNLSAVIFC